MRSWWLYTGTKHARLSSMLLLCCVSATFARSAHAQTSDKHPTESPAGIIRGTVTVTDQESQTKPLEGVSLQLSAASPDSVPLAAATDADGHYEFSHLPAGDYTLRVNQPGLKPFLKAVTLGEGETKVEDAALSLETVAEEVKVTDQAEALSTENSAAETTVKN